MSARASLLVTLDDAAGVEVSWLLDEPPSGRPYVRIGIGEHEVVLRAPLWALRLMVGSLSDGLARAHAAASAVACARSVDAETLADAVLAGEHRHPEGA